MRKSLLTATIAVFSILFPTLARSEMPDTIGYRISLLGAMSFDNAPLTGLLPHYMTVNRHGIITQQYSAYSRWQISKTTDPNQRFSWGAGIDLLAGNASAADYEQYSDGKWIINPQRPAAFFIQQLYAEVKWRSLFLTAGMKQRGSALLNNRLSSGDMIEGCNARPIPQVRAGFIDFQDIPFTNGWVQFQAELAYGKFADYKWKRNHYNYYSDHLTSGVLYNYKRCYFRTKPSQPLSVTVGMQATCLFGGRSVSYKDGTIEYVRNENLSFSDIWRSIIPAGDGEYFHGNHIGSWDLQARYNFTAAGRAQTIKAYFQWPWEDGSGIGKLNGWDGLWGLEWNNPSFPWLSSLVVEYISTYNQSGPIHFDPNSEGSTMPGHATGNDDYYNHFLYNGYANYGMSLGTPMLAGPITNFDGYLGFVDTRVRGFHIGAEGSFCRNFTYRLLGGHRKGLGTYHIPRNREVNTTSFMIEFGWVPAHIEGLGLNLQIATDRSNRYGNNYSSNTGVCLTVSYCGLINLKR